MTTAKPGLVATLQSPHCDQHIAWIVKVFGAEQVEMFRSKDDKTVMHSALIVNGSYLYLNDSSTSMERAKRPAEEEGKDAEIPESRGIVLHLELEDPHPFWKSALENGASAIEDLKQQAWGALYGSLRDPFGFAWGLMKGGDCRKPGVIPYLVLDAGKGKGCVEWLAKALGGTVKDKFKSSTDDDLILHCTVEINGGLLYLADDIQMPQQRAEASGHSPRVVCHMDLPDARAVWETLLQNEASVVLDLAVQFWGDLYGTVQDGMGYLWSMSEATPTKPTEEAP